MSTVFSFFSGVRAELAKVVWPKGSEFWNMMSAVAVVVTFFAIAIAMMDVGFNEFMRWIISS
jgi:preprotein translocase SecE subunit